MTQKTNAPLAIVAKDAPLRTKPSNYPEPFFSRMAKREKRPLGDLFGLQNFGVNLTKLAPGGESALLHRHSKQDEFIYILDGEPTLITDQGEAQKKLFQFANLGVFAEETVVKATQAVRIPKEVPLTSASLIGCGVLTGVGAVFNRAKVQQGESVVVIGVGGIGLNAIQGAALSGGLPVIAVDTNPGKESFAKQFGATHFICPDGPDFDLVAAVKEICPNGVDYVFECVGSTALIRTSTDLLDWGGTLVMLGVPKMGSEASFVVNTMNNDKTIMGCRYGSARPQYDIPLMVELYQAGRLQLDELVSRTYPLEDFNLALDELHEGKLARGVLTLV